MQSCPSLGVVRLTLIIVGTVKFALIITITIVGIVRLALIIAIVIVSIV